jgi:hypothetical protein
LETVQFKNVLKVMEQCVIQSDEKENKSEQALQIIGHAVAELYTNNPSMHGRRQVLVSNESYDILANM